MCALRTQPPYVAATESGERPELTRSGMSDEAIAPLVNTGKG